MAAKADLSEFDALERSQHPTRCKLARLMDELSAQDRVNVAAALKQDSRSNLLIVRWFKSKGIEVRDDIIRRHRRGDCVCARSK